MSSMRVYCNPNARTASRCVCRTSTGCGVRVLRAVVMDGTVYLAYCADAIHLKQTAVLCYSCSTGMLLMQPGE